MRKPLPVAALVGVVTLSGCASIISNSNYPVSIQSDAPDTRVVVRNSKGHEIYRGTAPTQLSLDAGSGYFGKAKYSVDFEKEGYLTTTQSLDASLDGWYFGNILLGGLIGMLLVDPVTGAMWKLPDSKMGNLVMTPEYQAQLKAEAEAAAARDQEQAMQTQPAGRTAGERLVELKSLYEQDVLTESEYEAKRASLLEEI